jgi:hypothetical protein
MLDYLKRAFATRWNLLLFFGAAVGAALTPWPDSLLPLIAAGEMIYLGGLVSIPRFREAVDAEVAERARTAAGSPPVKSVTDMLGGLNPDAQLRFMKLRKRCLDMRSIAQTAGGAGAAAETTDLWTPALDRLLYGFLRLLGQHNSLLRFLRSTTEPELVQGLDEVKKKLAAAQGAGDERMIHSLQESVSIAEQRLDNYQKAEKNAEYASLELDRVEAKIQALIEMAANRQDPNLLSSQVDAAADSMHRTESTLNQLQQITSVADEPDVVPAILDQPAKRTVSE